MEGQNAFDVIKQAYKRRAPNLSLSDIDIDQFIYIPAEIGRLDFLEDLHISGDNIARLPREIGKLRKLKYLTIGSRNLNELPNELSELSNLEYLWIYGNFTQLPSVIFSLQNLKCFACFNYSPLNTLSTEISQLRRLIYLDLGLGLRVMPAEIGKLQELRYLKLSSNDLKYLPPEIGNLTNLKCFSIGKTYVFPSQDEFVSRTLKLSHPEPVPTKVSKLPKEIRNLTSLEYLDLRGNPLSIPPEILEKNTDPHSILNYYFSVTEQKRKSINEIKLLVIGQGSVGKTSIIQRILNGTFDQNQTKTEGIFINKWQVQNSAKRETIGQFDTLSSGESAPIEDPKSEIKLNIWDFGGQEIMHATHQFFLTKRSCYLLVLDARLTQEENRVEYWLKIIQSFGGESPVLIVGNKSDQHPLDIDRTGLQKKYPNIVDIIETSAATGAGIEELKIDITEQVNNLPHVHDLLPESWFTIKTKLEELGRQSNFLTQDTYIDLCAGNEVSDETSQRTLIGFLHDLGVILHFQDDPRLEALGILNPQWVTNGVYKILNSHALFENRGVLTMPMLDEILNLPEYPRGKRLFIVDIMKKFELCYDIKADNLFLVPDLLPKDEPDLKFHGIPAFEYAYPVLPSSVMTRFIVRMSQHIHDGFVWRTGVLLKIGENHSLVKADIEDRKITIAIDGLEHTRRDALSAIRYQLDEIHNSIKGLEAQKRVPIRNAPNGEPLEYEYLLMLEREGQETHLIRDGTRLVKINVREVLSGIENASQRKETGGNVTNIYVGGNFDGNLTVGDGNQSIKDSYNKIASAQIDTELQETLKQLVQAVAALAQSLPSEQAAEATDELSKLVQEATKPVPNKKWYSVSIEGLIKAAENVENVGEPVINLSRKVLSLLTGGVIK